MMSRLPREVWSMPADPGGADPADELTRLRRENAELRRLLETSVSSERALEHELQHRVQNMLAVIRSIYRQTRESSATPEEFADHFGGRLDAVARYQKHVDGSSRPDIELEDIVRDELHNVRCGDGPDCIIDGPSVALGQKSTELIGLAIHELTTNSIKFGALSRGGALVVRWSVERNSVGRSLRFHWTETGVSMLASAPRRSGFGRQLIEQALPYQLSAETSFALKPGGIECEILLPLPEAETQTSTKDGHSYPHLPKRSDA
jgi:two-component sensor histidine kinase